MIYDVISLLALQCSLLQAPMIGSLLAPALLDCVPAPIPAPLLSLDYWYYYGVQYLQPLPEHMEVIIVALRIILGYYWYCRMVEC
jgi:hypothetical protein